MPLGLDRLDGSPQLLLLRAFLPHIESLSFLFVNDMVHEEQGGYKHMNHVRTRQSFRKRVGRIAE